MSLLCIYAQTDC